MPYFSTISNGLITFPNDFDINLDKIIERDLVVKDYVLRKYS